MANQGISIPLQNLAWQHPSRPLHLFSLSVHMTLCYLTAQRKEVPSHMAALGFFPEDITGNSDQKL